MRPGPALLPLRPGLSAGARPRHPQHVPRRRQHAVPRAAPLQSPGAHQQGQRDAQLQAPRALRVRVGSGVLAAGVGPELEGPVGGRGQHRQVPPDGASGDVQVPEPEVRVLAAVLQVLVRPALRRNPPLVRGPGQPPPEAHHRRV
ncbi:hypothetical protein FOCC_FOCC005796 [Frankliniella occidentalis]|nr:hypothetical protein FOCC_FOCC005796 [Frankliniella occidentalis]